MGSDKSHKCLICSKESKLMIPLENLLQKFDGLTLRQVLETLSLSHFSTVEDLVVKFGQDLCLICVVNLQSAFILKRKCDRIEKEWKTDETNGIFPPKSIKSESNFDGNEKNSEDINNAEIKSEITIDDDFILVKQELNSETTKTDEKKNSNDKTLSCPYCKESFKYNKNLRGHLRSHSGEKPFVCDVCNKSYSHSNSLKTHKLTHSNAKSHICDICNKSFSRSTSLIVHKITHAKSLKKGFVCDVCSKSFTYHHTLVIHKVTHTGGEMSHVCNVCDETFNRISQLNSHKLIHMNAKSHVCDICNKTFAQKCKLDAHKISHTGESPYVCGVCNKSFSRASSLSKHKKLHTNLKE